MSRTRGARPAILAGLAPLPRGLALLISRAAADTVTEMAASQCLGAHEARAVAAAL